MPARGLSNCTLRDHSLPHLSLSRSLAFPSPPRLQSYQLGDSPIHPDPDNPTPDWVHPLDMAVWISGPDGNITFINRQAEELLTVSAQDCLGLPCHRVIGGIDPSGRPFCGPNCQVACRASANRKIAPVKFQIPNPAGDNRSIQVITMVVSAPDGPSLVHCAISLDTAQRAEQYLTRMASRTAVPDNAAQAQKESALTAREKEVLVLLARDMSTYAIAAELHMSHTTVRNHIQRLLPKVGAHSIMEAVARHLLSGD